MPATTEKEDSASSTDDSFSSTKDPEECTATEEYAAVPEGFFSSPALPTFHQRKYDIFQRLNVLIAECRKRFSGRKELASEDDESVAELCETLELAFQYGLKQEQPNFVVSAASLFQNMQEIVIGSSSSKSTNNAGTMATNTYFWDFCKNFLTNHEMERFEQMKQTWTKWGKGRSFLRACLNEHSLHRYILTWLSDKSTLHSYYTHWSLLTDDKIASCLPELVKSLDHVLFALAVDKTELNAAIKMADDNPVVIKEEPLIYAPLPVEAEPKSKRKSTVIERPIATTSSTEDLIKVFQDKTCVDTERIQAGEQNFVDIDVVTALDDTTPSDPIEPELEFLKQPLPYYEGSISSGNSFNDTEGVDVRSETWSHCSKTSNNRPVVTGGCEDAQHIMLEQQLKDVNERCSLLETRVAQLSLENRQLIRRLKQHFEDSGIDPSSSFATNFLITIPHVKLQKSKHGASSYHLYEIHITMRQNLEHWSLWRRYSDFNNLHKSLLKTHPSVSAVEFPPKKRFGNMNQRFVEERRQQLQIYLLNLVETLPQLEACKSKAELQKVFSFLRER